jgi:hypothetical protein
MSSRTVLMIVARDRPDLYERLRKEFTDEHAVKVVLDRRFGQRRRDTVAVTADQRRAERRRRDIDSNLQRLGWATARCA